MPSVHGGSYLCIGKVCLPLFADANNHISLGTSNVPIMGMFPYLLRSYLFLSICIAWFTVIVIMVRFGYVTLWGCQM